VALGAAGGAGGGNSGGALGRGRGLRGGGAHHGSIWDRRRSGDGAGERARQRQVSMNARTLFPARRLARPGDERHGRMRSGSMEVKTRSSGKLENPEVELGLRPSMAGGGNGEQRRGTRAKLWAPFYNQGRERGSSWECGVVGTGRARHAGTRPGRGAAQTRASRRMAP
jgi:hypothetical protein